MLTVNGVGSKEVLSIFAISETHKAVDVLATPDALNATILYRRQPTAQSRHPKHLCSCLESQQLGTSLLGETSWCASANQISSPSWASLPVLRAAKELKATKLVREG